MSRLNIDIGAADNDGTGNKLRIGGAKINANFEELYAFRNQSQTASLTVTTPTVEVGNTIVHPAFTASYSSAPDVVLLNDSQGTATKDVTSTNSAFTSEGTFVKNVNGQSVTFTLTATFGTTDKPDTKAITWLPRVYWGIGDPGGNNAAFITGLASSALQSSRAGTFTVTAGTGKKIYRASPVSFGAVTFSVGGFVGGFTLVGAISVTNAYGIVQDYYLYESENADLGLTTVTAS